MCKKGGLATASVAVLLLALTALASFFDYEIANALYLGQTPKENLFGIIFAFIGIIPSFVGWSFLGAGILSLSKRQIEDQKIRKWLTALSVLLFVLSFFYFCNTLMMVNNNAFKVHWAIAYPIGIAVLIGAAFWGYKLSEKIEDKELLKKVLLLVLTSLIILVVISSTKNIMNRPRFRFVLDTANPDHFRNWWQSGRDIKASLGTSAASDEFTSLPSGHSAYSMFAVFIFPLLGDYIPSLSKYKPLLFIGGFIWWGLTAYSRLTIGAHYLSDVCIAGIVTILAYCLANFVTRIITKKRKSL